MSNKKVERHSRRNIYIYTHSVIVFESRKTHGSFYFLGL